MSGALTDSGQIPVVPRVVAPVLLPGVRPYEAPGRAERRRARRQRRLLATGALALLSVMLVAAVLVIGVVR
jgi:hypothetical protein